MKKSDIDALVSTPVPEGRTIDYKESLGCLSSDKGKSEFLRDVSSFANTAGGTIYFGITEARDGSNQQTGVPEAALGLAGFNPEAEISRIENILATGIEPRVSISPEIVVGFPNGPVLALRIHQSWTGPHMAREGRFYARDNTGKKPMDYHMIRDSFLAFKSLANDVRAFHEARRKSIFSRAAVPPTSIFILHALPVSAFVPVTQRSLSVSEMRTMAESLSPISYPLRRPNLDGLLLDRAVQAASLAEYVQIFRTGVLERILVGFTGEYSDGGQPSIPVVYEEVVGRFIRETIASFLSAQRTLALAAPIVLMIAAKGVFGRKLIPGQPTSVHSIHLRDSQESFDRDYLLFPEIVCEDLETDFGGISRQFLSLFWQAGGHTDYDPLGLIQ